MFSILHLNIRHMQDIYCKNKGKGKEKFDEL